MSPEYVQYLNSPEWAAKRGQRLSMARNRCAACSLPGSVDVHHLTYERIFQEDMMDLLPLCRPCHDKAEALVRCGKLPRSANVLFLATETVRLILAGAPKMAKRAPKVSAKARKKVASIEAYNLIRRDEEMSIRIRTMTDRKQFKAWLDQHYETSVRNVKRSRYMSHAMKRYDTYYGR